MEVKIYRQGQSTDVYVEVLGRVVLDACETFRNAVSQQIDLKIDLLHIDLSNVDFIDSAGLGVMVGIKMMANTSKVRLILVAPSKNVYDILYVSKLENIFDIVTGAEAELLRTSMSAPEHLIQTVVSESEDLNARPSASSPVRSSGIGTQEGTVPSGTSQDDEQDFTQTSVPSEALTASSTEAAPRMQEPRYAQDDAEPKPQTEEERLNAICKQALELMRQGLYEKAASKYEEALDINKDYLPALNNLAIVYEKKPDWQDKAQEQWQRVLEVSESLGDEKHARRARKHLSTMDKQA